jgi:D-aspartate ligase
VELTKNKPGVDAVVLGCWENGYGVIRQLAREKLRVAAVFNANAEVWRLSRYVKERKRAPNPAKEPAAFLDFLLAQAKHWRGALMIPTNDHYLEVISRNKNQLSTHYRVLAADYAVVANLLDKSRLYQIAQAVGINTPLTHYYDSPAALASEKSELSFPCLIKPTEGHRFFEIYGHKLFIVKDRNELQEQFTDAFAKGLRAGVQETIPGPDTNLYSHTSYTSEDGSLLFEGIKKKLRQNPAHFGVGRVSRTEWHPEVAELARRLLRALKYRGICLLEFKLDARTKRWTVLDANARFPLGNLNFGTVQAGINLPGLIYQDLVKGIRHPAPRTDDGVYWINLNEDLRNTFMVKGERFTLKEWLEPYRGEHIFADFDVRDPVPFVLRMGWLTRWWTRQITSRLPERLQPTGKRCIEHPAAAGKTSPKDEARIPPNSSNASLLGDK